MSFRRAIGVLLVTLLGACEQPASVSAPRHVRALSRPPAAPFASLLTTMGLTRLQLMWDPSRSLDGVPEGVYEIHAMPAHRLDLAEAVGRANARATSLVLLRPPAALARPTLFDVAAVLPTGARSAPLASGLVSDQGLVHGAALAYPDGAPPCLGQAPVRALAAASDGRVFVGTAGAGVAHGPQPDGTWERWTTLEGLLSNEVNALAVGAAGNVWVATDAGLQRYDVGRGEWSSWPSSGESFRGPVTGLAMADDGVLWIAAGGTLYRMARNAETPLALGRKAGEDIEDGDLLVELRARADLKAWRAFIERYPNASGGVRALAVAPDGALWLLGPAGGLVRRGPRMGLWVLHPTPAEMLAPGAVALDFAPGRGRSAWVATSDGLLRLEDAGSWQRVSLPFPYAAEGPDGMTLTGDGDLVLVAGGRVARCTPGGTACDTADRETSVRPARAIVALRAHGASGLWLGHADGSVARLSALNAPGERYASGCEESIPPRGTTLLALGPDGALWSAGPLHVARRDPLSGGWERGSPGSAGCPDAPPLDLAVTSDGTAVLAFEQGIFAASEPTGPWTELTRPETVGPSELAALPKLWSGAGGDVWLISQGGVFRGWPREAANEAFAWTRLLGDEVAPSMLAVDSLGGAWGLFEGGLRRVAPRSEARLALPVRGASIVAPVPGSMDLWLASADALRRFSPWLGTTTEISLAETLDAGDEPATVAAGPDGTAVLLARSGQIFCARSGADAVTPARVPRGPGESAGAVHDMVVDQDGCAWLASPNLGIVALPHVCR